MKSLTQKTGKSGVLSYGLYKMYKTRFTKMDKACDANVDYQSWLRICKKFNQRKLESIILRRIVFEMPFKLGAVGIIQFKRKIKFDEDGKLITTGLVPDWPKSWDLWMTQYPDAVTSKDFKDIKNKKVVFRTNEHTDGRIFRYHWKKKYCNIKNISAYELNIAPQYKKALGKVIFQNPNRQYCTKF